MHTSTDNAFCPCPPRPLDSCSRAGRAFLKLAKFEYLDFLGERGCRLAPLTLTTVRPASAQLLALGGLYASMWAQQAEEEATQVVIEALTSSTHHSAEPAGANGARQGVAASSSSSSNDN